MIQCFLSLHSKTICFNVPLGSTVALTASFCLRSRSSLFVADSSILIPVFPFSSPKDDLLLMDPLAVLLLSHLRPRRHRLAYTLDHWGHARSKKAGVSPPRRDAPLVICIFRLPGTLYNVACGGL